MDFEFYQGILHRRRMKMLWGIIAIIIIIVTVKTILEMQYRKLERTVLSELGFSDWNIVHYYDEIVTVKSRQTLEKYDSIKFFKENKEKLIRAENIVKRKNEVSTTLRKFLENNEYRSHLQYSKLTKQINTVLRAANGYRISINYTSPAGRKSAKKEIIVTLREINRFKEDPSLLMNKGEYNRLIKERQKEDLSNKHHEYYERVNGIIDYANEYRDSLVIKNSQKQLDDLMDQLYDRTVNSIKKIKTIDSEEWDIIGNYIFSIKRNIERVINDNQRILEYYESQDFLKIKETCEALMSSQKEFNEYIAEKVHSISRLFGTRVVRNETVHNDIYNYIRLYKKTITPFTAEVSKAVFASAENNPLEYVVKYFYPDKALYPKQIQGLSKLIEELETLKDAKRIIENYKAEYQQYLGDVPDFVMKNDEAGFYSRLGFTNIDESVLTIEYRFSYTSDGGMVQKSFPVPMTEETIAELIRVLSSKLTASAFAKEQRTLMTKKLREHILSRDNYTCCNCGNSIQKEPNLLLEIDHIIPVSKGGRTEEGNLQTLCWRCNRAKSNKIVS